MDASSPMAADKLALLWSLFGARSDVYARRWESASSGKAGWSPATKDRWSKGRPPRSYLPLTDEVFVSHLRGEETIGIYPLLRDDTCALLACDFDKGTWALDALAYLDACHRNAVPAALERSRSGNGAHVWIFFDAPVAASAARAMGAALLRQAMTARAELDLSSYDRFFPSQDFMPKAGFGNLIALPLHGGCAPTGTTVFLDPTDDGAVARPVGVPVVGRPHEPRGGGVAGRDAATGRHRPGALAGRAGQGRRAASAPGGPGPARCRAVDRAGGTTARGDRRVEAPRVDREPGVLREAAHAVLDLGHTPVHQRLPRGPRVAPPAPRSHRPRSKVYSQSLGSTLDVVDDRPEPTAADFEFRGALRPQQAGRGRGTRRPRPRRARRAARGGQDRHGLRGDRPPPHPDARRGGPQGARRPVAVTPARSPRHRATATSARSAAAATSRPGSSTSR